MTKCKSCADGLSEKVAGEAFPVTGVTAAHADDVGYRSPGPGHGHDRQLVALGEEGRGAGIQPRQHQVRVVY